MIKIESKEIKEKPKTTRERVEEKKKERAAEERTYKQGLTVGIMREANLSPLDFIDIEKLAPKIKDYPIDLSWEKCISLHNALLKSGPEINDNTPYIEALECIGAMFQAGFLLTSSKSS